MDWKRGAGADRDDFELPGGWIETLARCQSKEVTEVKPWLTTWLIFLMALLAVSCKSDSHSLSDLVVNSLEDLEQPPAGTVTLRSALARAAGGQRIVFDASLDGGTIALSIVGEDHTVLKGEVMGMRMESSGPVSYLVGYFDRDYGRSALYARKNVVIDASDLPSGITLSWTGGMGNPARVLAVYGNLNLTNVSVRGGINVAENISAVDPEQPWTLARGGGLAVWGVARLVDCQLYDNHLEGDFEPSRDRGAFGGGLYANVVDMDNCVVSGNSVLGAGAAGGGVYSVGGADRSDGNSYIDGSAITGNRIRGLDIPIVASGETGYFQAIDRATCKVSNVLEITFE